MLCNATCLSLKHNGEVVMLVRSQGSMWLDLNDYWIYKAFTYKCAERERKRTAIKLASPRRGWGSHATRCQSYTGVPWIISFGSRDCLKPFRQRFLYCLFFSLACLQTTTENSCSRGKDLEDVKKQSQGNSDLSGEFKVRGCRLASFSAGPWIIILLRDQIWSEMSTIVDQCPVNFDPKASAAVSLSNVISSDETVDLLL